MLKSTKVSSVIMVSFTMIWNDIAMRSSPTSVKESGVEPSIDV